MGLFDSIFGKKEEVKREATRLGSNKLKDAEEALKEESDVGSRWQTAKKWREDKAMEEPLIKRRDFKRKY